MVANDRQVAGNHYRTRGSDLQHWDIVAAFDLDYYQGQVTKYVMRWRDKNGIEDLEKAKHYLEKYIELAKEGKIRGFGRDRRRVEGTVVDGVQTDGGKSLFRNPTLAPDRTETIDLTND